MIKEESLEPSTLSEDKLTELTKVEVDNWDKQEKLHDMTEEMMDRLVIAKKIFCSIFGCGEGVGTKSDCLYYT
jgi:hypothetical protein